MARGGNSVCVRERERERKREREMCCEGDVVKSPNEIVELSTEKAKSSYVLSASIFRSLPALMFAFSPISCYVVRAL